MTYDELERALRDFSAIQDLVNKSTQENACLDFKRETYGNGESSKLELRKDATSLGNFRGGVILVGVDEDADGRASDIVPLANASAEADRLLDLLSATIHPRVADLRVTPIFETPPKGCVAIFLPPAKGPKYLIQTGEGRFEGWVRQDRSKRGMTHRELAEALRSDSREWRNAIRIEELVAEGKLFFIRPNLDAAREVDEWLHVAIHNLRELEIRKMSSDHRLRLPLEDISLLVPDSLHRATLVLDRGALDWDAPKDRWIYIPDVTGDVRRRLELAREIRKAMSANMRAEVRPIDRLWPRTEQPFEIRRLDRALFKILGKNCAQEFDVPLAAVKEVIASSSSPTITIQLSEILRYEPRSHTGWLNAPGSP